MKRVGEKHMLEAEESGQPREFYECLTGKAFPRNARETFYLKHFKSDFLTLYLYYIYTHYP